MSDEKKKNNDNIYDILIANSIYPDAAAVFTNLPKKLTDIKENCIVVLDTNALFVPYAIGQESLEQIKTTYKNLASTKRLIIPGQVAREFAKNRAFKLGEIFLRLSQKRNSTVELQLGRYPLLENLIEYRDVVHLEDNINKQIQEYRKAIGKVLEHIQGWNWDDPVSRLYNEVFSKDTIYDPEFNKDNIRNELSVRYQHGIPPGYKDSGKEDSGIGDLLIWKTILELGKTRQTNIILISGDEKIDWRHKIDKQVFYPRYELVDEFRRHSEGQSFHIVQFSSFLDLYGASKTVVQEVRQQEQEIIYPMFGIPNALMQILMVCHEILKNNKPYTEAVKLVADELNIRVQSVTDKCTRKIGIDTQTFKDLLLDKNDLINHLIDWFPENENIIRDKLQ